MFQNPAVAVIEPNLNRPAELLKIVFSKQRRSLQDVSDKILGAEGANPRVRIVTKSVDGLAKSLHPIYRHKHVSRLDSSETYTPVGIIKERNDDPLLFRVNLDE